MPLLWVAGEISNYTRAPSGHCYFTLKDERAQVRCVMFRTRALALDWSPANGAQVEVRALPSLYEARGEFQLTVEFMRRAGLGALFERFARLKSRLEAEGLFAAQRKRGLPRFPARIGLITSPAGAALRDVLTTLRRRMPAIPIVLYPTPVQGDGAGAQIARALATAGRARRVRRADPVPWRRQHRGPVGLQRGSRGARHRCLPDPGRSRAWATRPTSPSPTSSPMRVRRLRPARRRWRAPIGGELAGQVRSIGSHLQRSLRRALEQRMQQTDLLARRLVHPGERIARRLAELAHLRSRLAWARGRTQERARSALAQLAQRLSGARPDPLALLERQAQLRARLSRAVAHGMQRRAAAVARLEAHLNHLDPRQVLQRGYAIVTDEQGRIVHSSAQLAVGTSVQLALGEGAAQARVTGTQG